MFAKSLICRFGASQAKPITFHIRQGQLPPLTLTTDQLGQTLAIVLKQKQPNPTPRPQQGPARVRLRLRLPLLHLRSHVRRPQALPENMRRAASRDGRTGRPQKRRQNRKGPTLL